MGLLAVRNPGVLKHLNTFGLWAGLFVQIAGVVEALRRIAANPYGTFGIATANPQVVMAGASVASAQRPKVAVHTPVGDVSRIRAASMSDRDADTAAAARADRLDSVEEFVEKLGPKDFAEEAAKGKRLLDLIDSKLEPFIYRHADGSLDIEANQNDPMATRARNLHHEAVRMQRIADEVTRPLSGVSFINQEQ